MGLASLRGPGGIENLLFPSPRQLRLRRKSAQLGTTTAISATLPRPQESTSQIAQAGAGPRWEEKASPALSRQRRPPVNVSDVLRDSSGAWWLGRRAKLWPWDGGRSGSVSRGAVSHPALGPQPRSRFLSSQNFIPLSGVTCFALINLRNLPERSGNARPHPPTEGSWGGEQGGERGTTLAAAQIRGRVGELTTPAFPPGVLQTPLLPSSGVLRPLPVHPCWIPILCFLPWWHLPQPPFLHR